MQLHCSRRVGLALVWAALAACLALSLSPAPCAALPGRLHAHAAEQGPGRLEASLSSTTGGAAPYPAGGPGDPMVDVPPAASSGSPPAASAPPRPAFRRPAATKPTAGAAAARARAAEAKEPRAAAGRLRAAVAKPARAPIKPALPSSTARAEALRASTDGRRDAMVARQQAARRAQQELQRSVITVTELQRIVDGEFEALGQTVTPPLFRDPGDKRAVVAAAADRAARAAARSAASAAASAGPAPDREDDETLVAESEAWALQKANAERDARAARRALIKRLAERRQAARAASAVASRRPSAAPSRAASPTAAMTDTRSSSRPSSPTQERKSPRQFLSIDSRAWLTLGTSTPPVTTTALVNGNLADTRAALRRQNTVDPPNLGTAFYVIDSNSPTSRVKIVQADIVVKSRKGLSAAAYKICDQMWSHDHPSSPRDRELWQTGHILASALGGSDQDPLNFFPQHAQSNSGGGVWWYTELVIGGGQRLFNEEKLMAAAGKQCQVRVDITFDYAGGKHSVVPSGGMYDIYVPLSCRAQASALPKAKVQAELYASAFVALMDHPAGKTINGERRVRIAWKNQSDVRKGELKPKK